MNAHFLNLAKETSERNWSPDRCDAIPLCRWQDAWSVYLELLKLIPEHRIHVSPCGDGLIHFNILGANHIGFTIEYNIKTAFVQFDYSKAITVYIEPEIPLEMAFKILNTWWTVYK